MSAILAYIEPIPGRLYPLIPTLQELMLRGHHVSVRSGKDEVGLLRSLGIPAETLGPQLLGYAPEDWKARTRFGALLVGLGQFGRRAPLQVNDMQRAIAVENPDAILIDETSWGAAAAAEKSGIPWAYCAFSPVPVPSRDAPPFGLGLAPRNDALGRFRDRLAAPLSLGALARLIGKYANPVRDQLGLQPVRSVADVYLAGTMLLAFTAEPFEYPRSDWPAKVRLVGPGLWDPPDDEPAWLKEIRQPLVLVTCSTLFQNDSQLVQVACEAFAGAPFEVVVTTADVEISGLMPPSNMRIERYLPHAPILRHAACVVCHAGMGITQKALSYGVPVVAVPFGRDQPEVARRVEVARAGVRLPARKLTPDRLLVAVRRAVAMESGAERIARAFAAAGGAQTAAEAVEELARLSPTTRRDPAARTARTASPLKPRSRLRLQVTSATHVGVARSGASVQPVASARCW